MNHALDDPFLQIMPILTVGSRELDRRSPHGVWMTLTQLDALGLQIATAARRSRDLQIRQNFRWRPIKFRQRYVAQILDVAESGGRAVESSHRQVPESCEEFRATLHPGSGALY